MRCNRLFIIAAITVTAIAEASAQTQEQTQDLTDSIQKLSRKRAESLIPRPGLKPVKSMIPGQAYALDTLDTSNPRIKLVLYDDNTWKYVKDGSIIKNDATFTQYWNDRQANPYKTEFSALPDRVSLWLVDSTSQFCVPYQTKIYSRFGIRHGRRHQGVDLPLKVGDPIHAAFDGKVRISSYMKGYGNLVVIRHENGLETFYGHLSKRNVEVDQWVHAGDVIGLGGSTGRSTGAHLHFETRFRGYAFDPQWMIDFETGNLRHRLFVLKKKYLSASSTYVPTSDEEEDEIAIADAKDKATADSLAAVKKAAAEKAAANAAVYYKIKSGDTLYRIASRNGTTVSAIVKLNPGLTAKTTLKIGRTIRIK